MKIGNTFKGLKKSFTKRSGFRPGKLIIKKKKYRLDRSKFKTEKDILLENLLRKRRDEAKEKRIRKLLGR